MNAHKSFNLSVGFLSVKGKYSCLFFVTSFLQNVLDIDEHAGKKIKLIALAKEKKLKCSFLYFY